jgi:Glycosyl transferase family 2
MHGIAMKVAVVTVIKNEASDLAAWLAWYHTIGIDTIMLFDDGSDDHTCEIAKAASKCQDIRLLRTDSTLPSRTDRQSAAFREALARFGAKFEWMGFLDGDEYLHLPRDRSIKSFLSHYAAANGLGFSWCSYGSNGHVLKPRIPPVEAFTRHAAIWPGYNVIKSFVRPGKVGREWFDTHRLDVQQPYVDPAGYHLDWTEHGCVANPLDWSQAKIMQYSGRSTEHLIDRVRRRQDLRILSDGELGCSGTNEVEDLSPLERLPAIYRHILRIDHEILKAFLARCRQAAFSFRRKPRLSETLARSLEPLKQRLLSVIGRVPVASSVPATSADFHWIVSAFGTVLCADGVTGELLHATPDTIKQAGCHPVFAMTPLAEGKIIFLISSHPEIPLRIARPADPCIRGDILREHRIGDILSYQAISVEGEDSERFSLRHPRTGRFVTAWPPMGDDAEGVGRAFVTREVAMDWERFSLAKVHGLLGASPQPEIVAELASIPPEVLTPEGLFAWVTRGTPPSPAVFAALLTFLPYRDQLTFMKAAPDAALPDWMHYH